MTGTQQIHILPLENYLKERVETNPHLFPQRDTNYFEQYLNIKEWLTKKHFRDAGAGLATDGNRYTQHDLGHVNDVIEVAGCMLRIKQKSELLTGFETYILLVAILLHDSGNAEGRREHEQKTAKIIREMGDVAGTCTQEKKLAAKIARSHGGTTLYKNIGTKDTIAVLINSIYDTFPNDVKIRPRLLAAVLRLSDELAEKPSRANSIAVKEVSDPKITKYKPDVVHNLYCSIVQIKVFPDSHEINISFDVDKSLLTQKFKIKEDNKEGICEVVDVYLIDYIVNRLEKSDRERRYCNRFMMGLLHFDSISVTIEITNDFETLDTICLKIEERGFPDAASGVSIKGLDEKLDGDVLYEKYGKVTVDNSSDARK